MSTPQSAHNAVNQAGLMCQPFKPGKHGDWASLASALLWTEELWRAPTANAAIAATGVAIVVCTQQRAGSLTRFLNSLAVQDRKPDELIIVDASEDGATEEMLRQFLEITKVADRCLYFRVSDDLKGITHQRNFALRWVTTDLVVFFDDDVELLPNCLGEMERVHREAEQPVAGVGAFMRNQAWPLTDSWVWRARRRLRLVADLQPGRYHRSGISIPWNLPSLDGVIEGDWLPGCAMMWKTAIAREVEFYDGFGGYAQGEDLEFSLRARRHGRLLVSGAAHVIHYYEASGRPKQFTKGYMSIYNRYQIHCRALSDRTWRDAVWFAYALILDTLLLGRYIVVPSQWSAILLQVIGRLKAVYDIMRTLVKRAIRGRVEAITSSEQRTIS
jgi:GT2 family glycosyltransferase